MLPSAQALMAAPVITENPPQIDYWLLSPMLVIFGAAVLGVLIEAFVPAARRRPIQLGLALAAVAAAFVLTVLVADWLPSGEAGVPIAFGSVAVDRVSVFLLYVARCAM